MDGICLSWGSCSREHIHAGCHLGPTSEARASVVVGEGRQALTGAVLRVPAPLDGSGCVRGPFGPLRDPPTAVTPRRSAALFHAARALWSRPSELSLPEEPYPLSRASCFLAGSRSTACKRGGTETFAAGFPLAPTLCSSSPFRACWTRGPGRRFLATARRGRRTRKRARRSLVLLDLAGLAWHVAGTPASKLCSPRESVRAGALPWPGWCSGVGALLGFRSL